MCSDFKLIQGQRVSTILSHEFDYWLLNNSTLDRRGGKQNPSNKNCTGAKCFSFCSVFCSIVSHSVWIKCNTQQNQGIIIPDKHQGKYPPIQNTFKFFRRTTTKQYFTSVYANILNVTTDIHTNSNLKLNPALTQMLLSMCKQFRSNLGCIQMWY